MLDIKLIRNDPDTIETLLRTKNPEVSLSSIIQDDQRTREIKTEVEHLKAKRNQVSKVIGDKKRQGEDTNILVGEMGALAEEIDLLDKELEEVEARLNTALLKLPNIPMQDIKISQDPKDNVCIKEFGSKPEFTFAFKNHLELNEQLGLFDFKRGAKISGAGWPTYRGFGARLEWALLNYMLEIHINNGFEQWMLPLLVRPPMMYGSGNLPKFENQFFKLDDPDYSLYLIPTAEVALNGLHSDEVLEEEELPLKYTAYTPCFRREAGAAGSQERGLIRTHQFNKVEMFCFTKPEESAEIFELMISSAEEVLQGLGMHYRNMLLVTGDMSFSATRTVDIEVWLPGQNRYYEVSSVSNCSDFQARRSQIRFRRKGEKPELIHTLNGSGVATSRLMVALLENNQNEDGSVNIPKVLQKYLGGLTKLMPSE
jgi:seryl-tRNA synthetase